MARKGKTSFVKQQDAPDVRFEKWRKYKKFILVVCEDESTEPSYFKTFRQHFPEHTLYLEVVGTGRDPLGVVLAAINKRNELSGITKREIDETWVVFDRDDADLNQARIDRFNDAFAKADENTFNIAWSNEVFELWLLLHFIEVEPSIPINRNLVYEKLKNAVNNLLGMVVIADGHSNPTIIPYLTTHGSEKEAINRAEALLLYHNNTSPIEANPATKMHLLVQSLRDWIVYYNYDL